VSDQFERRVASALHADVGLGDAGARRRVMERIRREAVERPPVRRGTPWSRATRQSIVGLTLAAGIGGLSTLSAVVPSAHGNGAVGLGAAVLGDTVASTLRDTLRLVRLMFDAPAARRVAVAGDFNEWGERATPLVRDESTRQWSVTLALHTGDHRYAFVVDDTRWVPDPRVRRSVRAADGRVYSILTVAPATD
jgi:hypothetical protein